jgi:hypothetical protein
MISAVLTRRFEATQDKSLQKDGASTMKCWISFTLPLCLLATTALSQDVVNQRTFALTAQPKFVECLGVEGGPAPIATVVIKRGSLHDSLTVNASNLKPNLRFDLFTLQNTNLLANGEVNPNFKNFGLAWYQTDLQASSTGEASVTINTIILDQIFGFDPSKGLLPTHTVHVGFWFNDPQDAVACGFDASTPTPFNGEQNAGPNAMISRPDAITTLGPLCVNANLKTTPVSCIE